MNRYNLDTLLHKNNKYEYEHLTIGPSQYDKLNYYIDDNKTKVLQFYFHINEDITLSKNARFDTVPTHVHDYIEINYMYSGKCEQTLNGKSYTLQTGQMTLIDTKTPHSLGYTGEDDILMNFMIPKDYLNKEFFSKLTDHNLITQFFLNAINNKNAKLDYMIFNTENNERLQFFIHEYIWEYNNPTLNSKEILKNLFSLIILEMINTLEANINLESVNDSNSLVFSALKYMEENYIDCTLESTASYVHVNPCYLTSLLKKHLDKSYKELIIELRMKHAEKLLLNSDMTIDAISRACGYNNISFFYKKFKDTYNCLPKDYRNSNKSYIQGSMEN